MGRGDALRTLERTGDLGLDGLFGSHGLRPSFRCRFHDVDNHQGDDRDIVCQTQNRNQVRNQVDGARSVEQSTEGRKNRFGVHRRNANKVYDADAGLWGPNRGTFVPQCKMGPCFPSV